MTIQHSAIVDPDIHEPKGVATAEAAQVYVADGSGSGVWQSTGNIQQGVWDVHNGDLTPIDLTVADTEYDLTNDGLGANSYASPIAGVPLVWDASLQQFDFSSLDIGDTVDIRLDIEFVSSGANDAIDIDLVLAYGNVNEYRVPFISEQSYKTAGTHRVTTLNSIYIGNVLTRDNPARFVARSDTTGDSVIVNGWYVRVLKNV